MTEENKTKKSAPWPVIIMLAMLALVIGLGFVLSPNSEEGKLWWVGLLGTTNNGTLLNPPIELSTADILAADGDKWAALENTTFKLVVISSGSCEQACQDMLYSTRQLHVRLNRDYEDVERGFLALGLSMDAAMELVKDLPDYSVLGQSHHRLLESLSATNIPPLSEGPVLVMIDPANIAMMAYTAEHSGSEVLADLEHLLELAR